MKDAIRFIAIFLNASLLVLFVWAAMLRPLGGLIENVEILMFLLLATAPASALLALGRTASLRTSRKPSGAS